MKYRYYKNGKDLKTVFTSREDAKGVLKAKSQWLNEWGIAHTLNLSTLTLIYTVSGQIEQMVKEA